MIETARTEFLSRVAAAVRAGHRFRERDRREMAATTGYLGCGPDPIARLAEELQAIGAYPVRCSTGRELRAAVAFVLERYGCRLAVRGGATRLDELGVIDVLRERHVEIVSPAELTALAAEARRDRLFAADLGVTAPDWAIAETGTLVYAADAEQLRSATLLPALHLTVVDSSRVLADLFDLPARLLERSTSGVLSRGVAMVTGPSKTGDIELKLTTGVHGPGEVHVIIWAP